MARLGSACEVCFVVLNINVVRIKRTFHDQIVSEAVDQDRKRKIEKGQKEAKDCKRGVGILILRSGRGALRPTITDAGESSDLPPLLRLSSKNGDEQKKLLTRN